MKSLLHTSILLLLSFVLVACFGGGGGGEGGTITYTISKVSPLYGANGFDWNDYVVDDGATFAQATGTACYADTDTACLHGGEMRMVEITGLSSCTGITASDTLGAFDWICDNSTGTVRVISSGLASGYGLSDLVDFALISWKENSLTIYKDGVEIGTTTPAVWWTNTVNSIATGGVLGIEGEIWVIPSNITAGYTLGADKMALVAAPGVVINGPDGGDFSNVISASGKDFLWLEGMEIDAAGDSAGVEWQTVRFSVMRDIVVENADTGQGQYGIQLVSSSSNSLSNITANNNGGLGIYLFGSSGNTLSQVTANNNGYGVYLYESSGNTFSQVSTSNSDSSGVHLSGTSNNNTLSQVTASNNGEYGLHISSSNNTLSGVTASNSFTGLILGSSNKVSNVTAGNNHTGILVSYGANNMLSNITASNNSLEGIYLNRGTNNFLLGVTASNNQIGIFLEQATGNTFSGVTASNNNTGIDLSDSSQNYFTEDLQVGTNWSDCYVSNPTTTLTNPGIDDDANPADQGNDTVHNGLCIQEGTSDFGAAVTGITLGSSFVAKDYQDDSANTSDTDGNAVITDFALSFDWVNFENPYRLWGKEGSAFPSETNRGMIGCTDKVYTNQTDCETNFEAWAAYARIWDWSLLATDTVIKDLLPLPTGNDTLTHTWSDASTSTFLRNAVEIQGDDIGNDNTLCETNETCLYTPNMGSYQGHGNLISAGSIGTGGTLENIILMKYETNGY